MINWLSDSPHQTFVALNKDAVSGVYAVPLKLEQYWLPEKPIAELAVVFLVDDHAVHSAIIDRNTIDNFENQFAQNFLARDFFERLCEITSSAILYPDQPQLLSPIHIAKPWGQEIWYTGIEARGIAGITDGKGVTPIAWLIAAFPEWYGACAPILLKILDPYADDLLGDLYFELHQEKREVYVVTSIDPVAWPSGKGAIRFGFDQQMRQNFTDDEAFLRAYLSAVRAYEEVRRQIDKALDEVRSSQSISAEEPVSPSLMRDWLSKIDSNLLEQEQIARQQMYQFTHLKPLEIGDVVKVPTLLPHSLQHGVRTVEFQTPVYERMILSFAQKVLTQDHWDTEKALPLMMLDAPDNPPAICLDSGKGWRCEKIVDFADFNVERWVVDSGSEINLPAETKYRLIMLIDGGELALNSLTIHKEQAVLLPACMEGLRLANNTPNTWIFLIARPNL